MRDGRLIPLVHALAFVFALSSAAFADARPSSGAPDPSSRQREKGPWVSVRVAATPDEVRQLAVLLDELLARLRPPVAVTTERVAAPDPGLPVGALAVVSIDLGRTDRALCSLQDGRGRVRMAAREVAATATRAILLDELAHLVQASIESLLDEQRALRLVPPTAAFPSADPEPTPNADRLRPSPPPPAAPVLVQPTSVTEVSRPLGAHPRQPEQAGWGLDVAAMLGLHGMADSAPFVPGAGVAAHVSRRSGSLHAGGWVTAEVRRPFGVDERSRPSSAEAVALRALAGLDFYHRRPLAFGAALGGGIDIFRVDAGVQDRGEAPARSSATRVVPVLAGFGTMSIALAQGVQLSSLVGVEVDLDAAPQGQVDGRRGPEPWTVRPTLALGIAFTPLGVGLFD